MLSAGAEYQSIARAVSAVIRQFPKVHLLRKLKVDRPPEGDGNLPQQR